MKAVSIHFSPPAVKISGFVERTNAIAAKVRRKRDSVVKMRRRFARSQSTNSERQRRYAQALNPPRMTSPNSKPPRSFCARPKEANSQKIYAQTNRPSAREKV